MEEKDFKKIINFAIKNEVETYEFYRDAAKKVKKESLKEIFNELAKEELEHKVFLEDILAQEKIEIELDRLSDYGVAETIDKPNLSVEMKFSDAIGLAIKNEEEAMAMYNNLAIACLDKDIKKIFSGLEEMERTHKAKLEDVYLNVAYAEIW